MRNLLKISVLAFFLMCDAYSALPFTADGKESSPDSWQRRAAASDSKSLPGRARTWVATADFRSAQSIR